MIGKKIWVIPDCELPPEGEGVLLAHESVIVLNTTDKTANIKVELYFSDTEHYDNITWQVAPKRVKCFRMNQPTDMGGFNVPLNTQYAMLIKSDIPVIVQYGRLDNRQTNLAYYTTLGYNE